MKSSSNFPILLTYQNENIGKTERIANMLNSYFSTNGEKTKAKRKHSHKNHTDYLRNENPDSFFLSDKEEIEIIISSIDISKSIGPYRIPSKVLNMVKNDISEQLADLFNLPFTTGTFPPLLKTAKVIPIYKDS